MISCHSRELGPFGFYRKVVEDKTMWKGNGDRAEMSLVKEMNWMESKSPPVSIEDRSVVAVLIED